LQGNRSLPRNDLSFAARTAFSTQREDYGRAVGWIEHEIQEWLIERASVGR
jgi:hypothetical protein